MIQRDDIDVASVQQDAQRILDSFFDALRDVPDDIDITVVREQMLRDDTPVCDAAFKQKLLANAPKKNADFVLAEKKKW